VHLKILLSFLLGIQQVITVTEPKPLNTEAMIW